MGWENDARISRRQAVTGLAVVGGLVATGTRFGSWPWRPDRAGAAEGVATVTVDFDTAVGALPPGMVGFGFEKRTLTSPLFSADNAALVALFDLIGPSVLRVGGNTSEKVGWDPSGAGLTAGVVAPPDIARLADFAAATDSDVIYSTPFISGTAATVADEAAAARDALGPHLAGLELCNEPDLYPLDATTAAIAGGDQFLPRWDAFAAAVRDRSPGVPITGPASFFLQSAESFLAAFATADRAPSLLTQHYYRGFGIGPQTIPLMLTPDPLLATHLPTLRQRAADLGVGYRIDEANSFSNGGEPGVSNTVASALFAVELIFGAASFGCSGINFHTSGSGAGYPAFVQVDGVVTEIRPLFYGLLLAARAGSGPLLATAVASPTDLRAHTVQRSATEVTVVLTNPDPGIAVDVTLDFGRAALAASASRLQGPALDATTGTTFAGAAVEIDGTFSPTPPEPLTAAGNQVAVGVPAGSVVLVEVQVGPPAVAPPVDAAPPVGARPEFTG